MIGRLLKSHIASNLRTLIVVSLLIVVFSSLPVRLDDHLFVALALAWIMFGVAMMVIYGGYAREKRSRLIAQLPASYWEIAFAGWCFVLLVALIPAINLLVHMPLRSGWPIYSPVGYLMSLYLATVALGFAIAIGMRPINATAGPRRHWKWVPAACLILFIAIFFYSGDNGTFFFLTPGRPGFESSQPNWTLLIPSLSALSAGFVLIDIWMRRHADDCRG